MLRRQGLPHHGSGGTLPEMIHPAPAQPALPARFTVERYFTLVDEGVLTEDDRVELLEGVVVAMSPPNPTHDASVSMITRVLCAALGEHAAVRCQATLILGTHSAPQPDVAVVPGRERDYFTRHPTTALLVVEVADSSLGQDRLTKSSLYAAAGIPEYWIVNLRDHCIEVLRRPAREQRRYTERLIASRGESLDLVALPGIRVAIDDLLPDLG